MHDEERPLKIRKLAHSPSRQIEHLDASEDLVHSAENGRILGIENGQSNGAEPVGQNTTSSPSVKVAKLQDSDVHNEVTEPQGALSTQLPTAVPLSKNQQKKLLKKLEWEAKRDERKAVRKEKSVAKRERKRAAKQALGKENQAHSEPSTAPTSVKLPITIIIDCDFDDLMRDKERISLASQLTRSYSDNKKSLFRAHMTISSFGGKLKERFDTALDKQHLSWKDIRFLESDFIETANQANSWMQSPDGGVLQGAFAKHSNLSGAEIEALKQAGEVVYLSAEADDTLTELKPYSTYIIGGLVDKNREKGVCFKRATQRGIRTARLPIGDFLDMQSRKVLTTNHVNEIMLKWLELGDWGEAFIRVIPKRKGGKLKDAISDPDPDPDLRSLDGEIDKMTPSAEDEQIAST